MKIIQPSVELIDNINPADIYNKIERCGRVSHQSKPREETVGEFVRNESAIPFIRKIIKLGHESVLEHVSLTFHIICDRAIQNELVRHRHASFTVESTRYVKYDELTFISPHLQSSTYGMCEEKYEEALVKNQSYFVLTNFAFESQMRKVEEFYQQLIDGGVPPEQARAVLPLCLKSELYMTANLRELRHILKLRTSKAAHPQMRFIAGQILAILRGKLPVIVEDIQSC